MMDWPEAEDSENELGKAREQQAAADDAAYREFQSNRVEQAALLEEWRVGDLLRYLNAEVLAPLGKGGHVICSEGPAAIPAYILEWPGVTRGRPFQLKVISEQTDEDRRTLLVSSDGPRAEHLARQSVDTPAALQSALLAQLHNLVEP